MSECEHYVRRMTTRERGAVIALQNRAIETACEREPWFVDEYQRATRTLAAARRFYRTLWERDNGK